TDVHKVIERNTKYNFKFTFVDDGSSDNTLIELYKAKETYKTLSIVVFSRNFGQTNAFLAGLKYSDADAYILMSVDMQESPELIIDFINSWENGFKICIAYRKYRYDNWIRRFFSKAFYFIIRIDKSTIP